MIEACDVTGCSASDVIMVTDAMLDTIGYFKASNTEANDRFGNAIALSDDGRTLAVAATPEDSNATGIDGNQQDNSIFSTGAVYLLRLEGGTWSQQAYIKASNTGITEDAFYEWEVDAFGMEVALNSNGDTLIVVGRAGLSRTQTTAVFSPTNQPLAAALASISPIA